jgi:carbonic anhydrase/acetyltransferase-like protein (isoleucine patch superfamily)
MWRKTLLGYLKVKYNNKFYSFKSKKFGNAKVLLGNNTNFFDVLETLNILGSVKIGNNTILGKGLFFMGVSGTIKIGSNCFIDDGCSIHNFCTIKNHVHIGKGCILFERAKIHPHCHIGDNVIVKTGKIVENHTTLKNREIVE